MAVARYLEQHERVTAVHHPGLPSNPYHALAQKYLRGSSGLFSFTMNAETNDVRRFVDSLGVFQIGVSWGGFESLVIPSGLLSTAKGAVRPDLAPGLVRLSIGLENPDDLIADLNQAFESLNA